MSEYYKRRYNELKKQHRCVKCGKQDESTLNGKTNCRLCAKINTINVQNYRRKMLMNCPAYLITSLEHLIDHCFAQAACTNCCLKALCQAGSSDIKTLAGQYEEFRRSMYTNEKA